jgi:stromal membrane-associated protein
LIELVNFEKRTNKQNMNSWFELQSSMVSPFSAHQQQLMMLAQQQSLLMAAAAKSVGGEPKFTGTVQQPASNGSINLSAQSWANAGHQIPGMIMPTGGHSVQTFMQVKVHSRAYLNS